MITDFYFGNPDEMSAALWGGILDKGYTFLCIIAIASFYDWIRGSLFSRWKIKIIISMILLIFILSTPLYYYWQSTKNFYKIKTFDQTSNILIYFADKKTITKLEFNNILQIKAGIIMARGYSLCYILIDTKSGKRYESLIQRAPFYSCNAIKNKIMKQIQGSDTFD